MVRRRGWGQQGTHNYHTTSPYTQHTLHQKDRTQTKRTRPVLELHDQAGEVVPADPRRLARVVGEARVQELLGDGGDGLARGERGGEAGADEVDGLLVCCFGVLGLGGGGSEWG